REPVALRRLRRNSRRAYHLKLGILTYGSLIDDPGAELGPLITGRRAALTPFSIEYGRKSGTRGDAPALCPVKQGGTPFQAKLLMLRVSVAASAARDFLYRRACRIASFACCFQPGNPRGFGVLECERFLEVDLAVAAAYPQNVAPLVRDVM